MAAPEGFLHYFKTSVDSIELPERFTFPFCYEPHPIALLAAEELQHYIKSNMGGENNFGFKTNKEGPVIGKMFGVLVVKTPDGELGYLTAFSGKIHDTSNHEYFVPPVFDTFEKGNFFDTGGSEIIAINKRIDALETGDELVSLREQLEQIKREFDFDLKRIKAELMQRKAIRKQKRINAEAISQEEREALFDQLSKESQGDHFYLRDITIAWKKKIEKAEANLLPITEEIVRLKVERKAKSKVLQQQIFENYNFLNQEGASKNVLPIFEEFGINKPPSGAGECAAPKLLQYAYLHNLKPIAMAEFWWGESPNSDIKKHLHYYPSCRGKCEPILGHMLVGLDVDENPMLVNPGADALIETVFEDQDIVVINKPADLLSVPGKTILDSVYNRMRDLYPDATGPLIVHRLDMSTSGIMLIAKTKEANKNLQAQFIKRTVKKRYVALLDGVVEKDSGKIDLPLRVDLDDRPRQLVCYEHGKPALTEWKVVDRTATQTRIHFFPHTGRTHQLRVHAAHKLGLNTPITGDDLYGKRANRLHLHAERIEFNHPTTRELMKIEVPAEF